MLAELNDKITACQKNITELYKEFGESPELENEQNKLLSLIGQLANVYEQMGNNK